MRLNKAETLFYGHSQARETKRVLAHIGVSVVVITEQIKKPICQSLIPLIIRMIRQIFRPYAAIEIIWKKWSAMVANDENDLLIGLDNQKPSKPYNFTLALTW